MAHTVTQLHTGHHQLHVQIDIHPVHELHMLQIHGIKYMSYTCYDSFQANVAVVRTGSDGL